MSDQSVLDVMSSGSPLLPGAVTTVARAIARQLAPAHDQGIAHGDVGPHTVQLTVTPDGEVTNATLISPRPDQRPANWPLAPEVSAAAAEPPQDVFALGQLLRALDAYASPGATRLPLLAPAMIAEDAAHRPTMRQLLYALVDDSTPGLPVTGTTTPPTAASHHPSSPQRDPLSSEAPTVALPVGSIPASAPAPSVEQHPVPPVQQDLVAAPAEQRSRRTPVVLGLVGTLLVAAAIGGGYAWLNRADDSPTAEVPLTGRNIPAPPSDGDLNGDQSLSTADLATLDAAPTATDPAEASADGDGAATDPAASAEPSTSGPSTTGPAADSAATDSSGTAAAVTPTPPATATPSVTAPPAPTTPPATVAPTSPPGSDAASFDAAYCRDRGTFVALADTNSFRAIICESYGSLTYHGLNRGDGLTITTPAVATSSGWTGTSAGGGAYEVSRSQVRVLQGSTVLASEAVHTFVDSSDFGTFRPGDLDLTQLISYPECDGAGVVIINSFVGNDVADQVQDSLDRHPGSSYLRTDLSCDNFNRPSGSTGGANIYATYYWVGYDQDEVCEVAESVDSYAYWLRDGVESGNTIDCG